MIDDPVQLSKVQPPALRAETLERPRLLDWLRAKTHRRVLLILADAGYGKTTLLADFSRRTRLRTLWYRLDAGDRDWRSLIRHVIAAGRQYLPEFASRTSSLMATAGPGGPSREDVLDAFIAELPAIAESGAVLVLDDFHEVDDAADVRVVLRQLLERAPDRLTFILASRRPPGLPLAKLRALGEVAELGTDDLRFDIDETTLLFNETYGRSLEPDVVADLANRTEGWAASLHLVQAALRDRSPSEIRRFVRGMTGADHDLYDYLAEEVIGDLPADLQRFLMEVSILQVVTPELAETACGCDRRVVSQMLAAAERLTLLSRLSGEPRTSQRYHPLVREFLEARLKSADGIAAVADRHRRVAATSNDWHTSAHHYREAGEMISVLEVIGNAIPAIMANGQYALAEAFIGDLRAEARPPRIDLIRSRVDMQLGDYEAAISTSLAVLESHPSGSVERDHALLNLVTLYLNFGDGARAVEYAQQLLQSHDPNLALIARASVAMVTGSETDDIDRINRLLISMAESQRQDRPHHYAVTQYNLASNYIVQDRPEQALLELGPALEILESGSAAMELAAARVLRAQAFAMLGSAHDALVEIEAVQRAGTAYQEDEIGVGIADILDSYLDPEGAAALFESLEAHRITRPSGRRLASLSRARFLIRRHRHDEATVVLADYPIGRPAHLGIESALSFTRAYAAVASHQPNAREVTLAAVQHARAQGAHRWRHCGELILALVDSEPTLSRHITRIARDSPQALSYVAELISERLHDLDESALDSVISAAGRHRQRWLSALRMVVDGRMPAALACARVLELVGERQDIRRLRKFANESKRRPETAQLGRQLARRLATKVFVEDQGRVWFRIGRRDVLGSSVRRKVLALVCFLLTRPQMSSTRDQLLDALWPDLDPDVAANSLNQTIYFLRRVFEEDYDEDLSPGYVHHDSDVIWLDRDLITSRSVECRALIRALPNVPDPDEVEALVEKYEGRFALDFEYEEWTAAYRDSLHAAYLEIVERSVLADLAGGHHDRGIRVARRAFSLDESAENVEVSLLRLYRVTGAHSAAAEQYSHYSGVMRDEMGLEPPPLEAL